MRPRSFLLQLSAPLILGSLASGQTVELVAREGDPVIASGLIQTIQNLVINDVGSWLVLADTDAPSPEDFIVLRQGFPAIGESDPVADPPSATVSSLQNSTWRYDDHGNILWNFRIGGVESGTDNCLYWNTRLLARQRSPVNATNGGVSPDTFWKQFYSYDFAEPNHIIVFCELDDPNISSPSDDAVVEIFIDQFGFVTETNVLIIESQSFPVDLDPTDLDPMVFDGFPSSTSIHFAATNRFGDFAWGPETQIVGPKAYILVGFDRLVARVGQTFSGTGLPDLDGRFIDNFNQFELDMNDFGDVFFTAGLNGAANTPLADTNAILMLNDQVYIQEGQTLPSLGGAKIGNTTAAPLYVSNSRDLFWAASLNNTLASENLAYMRNKEVILRKGVDFIDDFLVQDLRAAINAFSVSKDGRYWMAEVVLQGGQEAVVMADFGLALEIPGCFGNPGTLKVRDGKALVGELLRLNMSQGQAPGVTTVLFLTGRSPIGGECGAMTPFGELLAPAPYAFIGVGPPWVGPPAIFNLNIPNNVALVDTTWYAQGMFVDLAGTLPGEDIRLTNGMKLEIGAP